MADSIVPIRSEADAAEEAEKRQEQAKQLRMVYGRVFGSPDGMSILADLQARFGWKDGVELPSFQPGLRSEDAIHRDGMKEPIRYISRMVNAGQNKPNEA